MSLDLTPLSAARPTLAGQHLLPQVLSCPVRVVTCASAPLPISVFPSAAISTGRPSKPSSWAVSVCDPVPMPRRCPAHHASRVLPARVEEGMAPGCVLTAPLGTQTRSSVQVAPWAAGASLGQTSSPGMGSGWARSGRGGLSSLGSPGLRGLAGLSGFRRCLGWEAPCH